jgi:Leucine-rich repeat (LRR) protein
MRITNTRFASDFCTVNAGQQNAAVIRKWSQAATTCNCDAIKVQEAVQNAVDHLRKPGTSLHFLDLAECGLTSLPPLPIWQQLQGITILNLNQNRLPGKELEKLTVLDSLQYLNISDNPLGTIPDGMLARQTKLQTLEADGCELQQFPQEILALSWLNTLSLQDNPLRELPESMGSAMISLGELNIQGTEITHLPASLAFIHRLVVNQ